MIKAAKPGILPDNYPVPGEICTSTLFSHSFEDLGRILASLINGRVNQSRTYKKKRLSIQNISSPEIIYNQLITGKE